MAAPPERPGLLRPLLLTALLSLCAFALPNLLWPQETPPAPPEQARRVDPGGEPGPGPATLMAATPKAVLERLDATYRLEPDRRFLAAARETDELLGRGAPAVGRARFVDGGWELSHGERALARVGELPDFGELYGFVEAVVAGRVEPGSVQHPPPPLDLPDDPVAALSSLEYGGDSIDWTAAACAYASLLLVHEDRLEVADEVAARGLAVLALAERRTGRTLLRPRVVIAQRLGYERDAAELAQGLAPEDPLRPWVLRDAEPLRALATRPDASPVEVLLYAQVLATGSHYEPFIRFEASLPPQLRVHPGILALSARYGAPGAADAWFLFHSLGALAAASDSWEDLSRLATLEDLARRLAELPPYGLVGHTELMLDRLEKRKSGRLLDGSTHAAVHRARTFSALERVGHDLNERLASREGSRAFAELLGAGRDGAARDFVRYFEHRIDAEARTLSSAQLRRDFEELLRFGPISLHALLGRPEQSNPEPEAFRALASLIRRADTRIEHRDLLTEVVRSKLLDLVRAEKLGRSVLHEWPHREPYLHAYFAVLDGDSEGVLRWLGHPAASAWMRASILHLAEHEELLDDTELRRRYEELVALDPADWSVVERYVAHLEDRDDWSAAQAQIEAWLARRGRRGGMPELAARTRLAKVLYRQGRLAEAWIAVHRPLEGSYGGAFQRGSLIRLDQDRLEEAAQIAQAGLERYPGTVWMAARLARVLWRQDRFAEAAAALKGVEPISWMAWRDDVGPDFADEFSGAPGGRVEAALAAILAAGFHPKVREELAAAAHQRKDSQLAFRIVENGGHPVLVFDAYTHLERWKGRGEAMAWLDSRLPKGRNRCRLAMCAFEARLSHVLWELIPDPATQSDTDDYLWLARTASWLREGSENEEWRQRLEAHYSGTRGSFYDRIAGMLLGQVDEASLWSEARRIDQRVEAAYFIGLRAEARGDVERAVSWYRATVESGRMSEGETHWALHQLWRLRNEAKSLARLAGTRV